MNIQNAKEEIKNTIRAYLRRDANGEYIMPQTAQRPVLLMGPPGIGKTQIVSQIAQECGVGLVSYTITHHTRQSAMGLPQIVKDSFEGTEYSVTDYTMSEIIASVYRSIRDSGIREGILFIDEINCVSETLTPAMLQFLQCKTFGTWKVPDGWVIVAAGNPPEYNRSVKDYDMVTLDRVRYINIDVDYEAWEKYATDRDIHPAVMAYLKLHPTNFYRVSSDVDGLSFVTARGWEDLSSLLTAYESMDIPVNREIIYEYLRHDDVSEDFDSYLKLYNKYRDDYGIEEILKGKVDSSTYVRLMEAQLDERISVVNLLVDALKRHTDSTRMENAFKFMEYAFEEDLHNYEGAGANKLQYSEGQEMTMFVTGLSLNKELALHLAMNPNDKYLKYSEKYLGGGRRAELLKELGQND